MTTTTSMETVTAAEAMTYPYTRAGMSTPELPEVPLDAVKSWAQESWGRWAIELDVPESAGIAVEMCRAYAAVIGLLELIEDARAASTAPTVLNFGDAARPPLVRTTAHRDDKGNLTHTTQEYM